MLDISCAKIDGSWGEQLTRTYALLLCTICTVPPSIAVEVMVSVLLCAMSVGETEEFKSNAIDSFHSERQTTSTESSSFSPKLSTDCNNCSYQ